MAIYQLVSVQSIQAQEINNIFYYESASALSDAQLIEAAGAFRIAYSGDVNNELSAAWAYAGLRARRVDQAGLPTTFHAPALGSLSGSQVTDNPLPLQVAFLAVGTAVTAYPRRARTYQAGFTVADVTATGFWATDLRTAMDSLMAALDQIGVVGDTLGRVAAQWASPSATHVTAWNRITSYQHHVVPATQRRRRIGVGI